MERAYQHYGRQWDSNQHRERSRGWQSVYWLPPGDPTGRSDRRGSRAASGPQLSGPQLSETQRVEAILLIAKEPIGARRIAELGEIADATRVRTLIADLNKAYDQRGRAIQIKSVAGGYQLLTRPQFAKWIRRLQHVDTPDRLSNPALETLAVVAYRQPIVRAEIDGIRGVNSGDVLRQLMEKDLVKIWGRSEDLGRPFLYATTRRFLKLFGLGNLDDLPAAGQLRRRLLSDKDTPIPDRSELDATSVAEET